MTGTVLERSLYSVVRRLQKVRVLRRQTVCWLLLLVPAIAVTLWLPARLGFLPPEFPVVLGATLIGILLARLFAKNPTYNEAARLVEQTHPELNDAVITAVQVSQRPGKRPSVLVAMAIHDADQLARQNDWSSSVSGWQIGKWTLLSFLSFMFMVSSVMAASRYGRDLIRPSTAKETTEEKKAAELLTELVIEPGDTEIELGSALTVVATFPGVVPTHAALEFTDTQGVPRQMAMTETVDVGVFAARMEEISGDGTYKVLYDEGEDSARVAPQVSSSFRVRTYIRPKLEQVDAEVSPPAWSGRPQETIEDVMRLTVTEGSTVVLKLRLNKPVALAELRPKDGAAVVLTPTAEDAAVVQASLVMADSKAWTVHLQDVDGRTPTDEEQISIKVTGNEPAKVKATFPGRDTNVSPLQEFLIEAQATDDFGIVNCGVQYSVSGGEQNDFVVKDEADSQDEAASTLNAAVSHRIELELLNAAPDDLVTYSFWASDIAVDGTERRSYSDIMFAEVRRFEEIFREAEQQGQQEQQQQGQQQQQDSAVDGVLQLQKEIISATWNTIRAEADKRKDGSFTRDVGVIAQSQGQAIELLKKSPEELGDDAKTAALAQVAEAQMTDARDKLNAAKDGMDGAKLSDAMPLEQSIVQTLLRMRAAEFQVRQQQQQGGGGGGGGGNSASQQQLQQLELDNSRNRYESEQRAQQSQQQTAQQREQVQVLNRLKELARRQQMVNERLKQLESELRTATNDKEREEIERELKRLRDEQREMLRDVDELSERMEQTAEQQNPKATQMKQQMEAARSNVQQASRAMDEGRLSEAIAEGTRAERQFEELKEEFRNQTSTKFDEAVRDLRDQARDLSDRQEQLARQLAGENPDGTPNQEQPSLRTDRNREQLQKDAGEQRDRLSRVVEQTKQMIEQSEQSEPLLSNKLYDTLRDMREAKPEEALEATELLAGRGMWSQSQQAEQVARKGIDQLRDGIEQAADSVLGSEAESLRRAQDQLEQATKQLAGEVQNATGAEESSERRPGQTGEQPQPGDSPYSERRPGQRGEQNPQGGNPQENGQPLENHPPGQQGQQGQNGQAGQSSKQDEPPTERQPGQQGSRPGQGNPSGEPQDGEQQQRPGQQGREGQQPGQAGQQVEQGQGEQGQGQQGQGQQQPGQGGTGSQLQNSEPQPGESQQGLQQRPGQQQGDAQNGGGGQRQPNSLRNGGREDRGGGGNEAGSRPLTGDDFREWSDQLRDVEEMLEDPELRNRVAQVRDRARTMRAEFKRHGEMPQWDLVKSQLLGEMQSLQQQIQQELSKLESDRAMVPIDREPVPEEFDSLVQKYYELLGQERGE